jgi:hypothetical protein
MAIWGKEAGGRAVVAHLVYVDVGCVGTQNQLKTLAARGLEELRVNLLLRENS